MTRQEWLLTCLAEESAELTQRATKALRFGINEIQAGQTLTNDERILDEFADIVAVMRMLDLVASTELDESVFTESVEQRCKKREKWFAYALEQGVITS